MEGTDRGVSFRVGTLKLPKSATPSRKLALVHPEAGEAPTEFSAADYLQLGRANGRTFRVEVGDGYIDMVDGVLHRAADLQGEGTEALMRLLIAGGLSGTAAARCFEGRAPGPKNLHIEVENALLEAARLLDEARRAADANPSEPPEPSTPRFESSAEAVEAGITAVLQKDYPTAYAAFQSAAELGDTSAVVRINLERLKSLVAD